MANAYFDLLSLPLHSSNLKASVWACDSAFVTVAQGSKVFHSTL